MILSSFYSRYILSPDECLVFTFFIFYVFLSCVYFSFTTTQNVFGSVCLFCFFFFFFLAFNDNGICYIHFERKLRQIFSFFQTSTFPFQYCLDQSIDIDCNILNKKRKKQKQKKTFNNFHNWNVLFNHCTHFIYYFKFSFVIVVLLLK